MNGKFEYFDSPIPIQYNTHNEYIVSAQGVGDKPPILQRMGDSYKKGGRKERIRNIETIILLL